MTIALRLYQQLTETTDDLLRAKLICDAIESIESSRAPNLEHLATGEQVKETESRLQADIRDTGLRITELEMRLRNEIKELELRLQNEIKDLELRLQKEIKNLELRLQNEIRETELRLQREIKELDSRLKQLELGVKEMELRLLKEIRDGDAMLLQAIHRQLYWIVGSVGTIIGFIRVLDWFLGRLN